MRHPDQLFLLVKSMTKAEKRYFKVEAAKFRSKASEDYIRFFDAVDAQKVYDEDAIRRKLNYGRFDKLFRDKKSYLHRQILKSLKNFYSDTSSNIKLNNYLSEIEVLYKKELFRNCAHVIKKAKDYAEKQEKFPRLMELVFWEGRVADAMSDMKQIDSMNVKWEKEVKEALIKYDDMNSLRRLSFESQSFLVKKGEVKSEKDKDYLRKLLSEGVMNRKIKSFGGELSRLAIRVRCLLFSDDNDYDTKLQALTDIVSHFESQPHQIDNQINVYFRYLLQIMHVAMVTKKFSLAENAAEKMKTLHHREPDKLMISNVIGFVSGEAYLLLNKAEFSRALDKIPQINKIIESSRKELDHGAKLSFYDLCFNIYFWNGDFKETQLYIQKIINYPVQLRLDVQLSARIANLIIQYEQKEYEHLRYVLRSTYRFMLKLEQIGKPERIILNFFKSAIGFSSQKQVFNALKEFKNQILPYADESHTLKFPFIEWIDSKLQKRSMEDIMREKYLQAVEAENVLRC